MAKPDAVRAAEKKSTEIIDKLKTAAAPAVAATAAAVPAPQPMRPPAVPAPALLPAAAAPAQPTPQPPAPAGLTDDERQRYEARLSSMNGRVQKAERERDEANQRTTALEARVDELSRKMEEASSTGLDLTKVFSKEQIEEFGEPALLTMVTGAIKAAKPEIDKAIERATKPLRDKLQNQEQSQKTERESAAKKAYDAFMEKVAEAVPSWETINHDPRFLLWLDQVNPETGDKRGDILRRAEQRLDHAVVIKSFTGFLSSMGASTPQPQNRMIPDGLPPSGAPPARPEGAITLKEIQQFQVDVSQNKFRGRMKEAVAFQKRIDEAIARGLVV